ncbi:hypothetical protein BGX28_000067 [Mortierella sp. GBA30]|nr:hypothetical protein BGX28_000067 [Mortierella sp. GBA30]
MSSHQEEDEFATTSTGYKPGQKKSLTELENLDADDDALRRWKESLGVKSAGVSKLDDPHNVKVLFLILKVEGRPDVLLDLSQSAEDLKKQSFTIKEGTEYRLVVKFKVQHEVVSGLKYKHVVKRMGVAGNHYKASMMPKHQSIVYNNCYEAKTHLSKLRRVVQSVVDRSDHMIGSYAANPDIIEKQASSRNAA